MRRACATVFATAIVALALPARSAPPSPLPTAVQVLGSVTNSARPVGNALVIALNLTNLEASQTFTSTDGTFTLPQLPAGIYKIIAVKYGFAPAMAMLVPTKSEHRIKLRLEPEGSTRRNIGQEMWEIRGSVPPDILHQIDDVMTPPPQASAAYSPYDMPRFRGEMVSMTGVAAQTAAPAFAQTTLGVQSRISDNLQIGFHGNLHRVEDPTDDRSFGTPLAESSTMQMEVRSSPTDAYRVASSKAWWRYTPGDLPADAQLADIRSHNFEWEHQDTRVQVRYLAHQNDCAPTPGSDLIEIAGNTTLMQTRRSGVGVALRVSQESLRNTSTANNTFRTADLTANAKFEVVPSFTLNYGMSSRLGMYGTEWAPRSGAELKMGKHTAFVVSGMYKVYDQERPNVLPSVVAWSDDSHLLPRYSYSFGIVSGEEGTDRFSAIGSVSATDAPMRVIFTDGFEHFWDGLYIETGDVRRDLRLAYRKELFHRILLDLSSSGGIASPRLRTPINREKVYLTGDLESTYFPTRTTLALSYRQIHQPQPTGPADFRTERVDVRVAQSMHILLDFKLLMGVEVARAANSPILLDSLEADGVTRKYIGGLALNF